MDVEPFFTNKYSILYFLYGISRWQLEDKDKFVFLQDVIMSLTEDIE